MNDRDFGPIVGLINVTGLYAVLALLYTLF